MTDPTGAEREALATRLRAAVPAEPDLAGLATRAEGGGRRKRRVRRAGVAAAAAIAVAAVIAIPQLVGSQPTRNGGTPSSPAPVQVPAHPCSDPPDHADFTQGTAAWVTFCPTTGSAGITALPAAYPPGLLDSAASRMLVSSWQHTAGTRHSCPATFGATDFTIRVGFTDGSTSRIYGSVSGCQAGVIPSSSSDGISSGGLVYSDLVTALGRQAASGQPLHNPPGPPRVCPTSLSSPGRLNIDGASATELEGSPMLLDLTAVEGLVCRYDGSGGLTDSATATDPEALRIASGSSLMGRPFAHWRHTPATSYLISLRDRTDTWRTFTVTGRKHVLTLLRGTSPGSPDRIGYTGETLLLMLHDSTR